MFKIIQKEMQWGNASLKFETGKMARQADGSVIVHLGETAVLATAVGTSTASPDQGFFPLTIHYQEKSYAVGKIPVGFFKREGRPSENEVLTSRLIDRPIRPLFPKHFKSEVQVICTVLSHDMENDPAVAAILAASAALALSGLPFLGPIGSARVGYIDGNFVLNPTPEQLDESALDLVVAGTKEGVLMVESEAKMLPEDLMLKAVMFGHESYQPVIKLINELKAQAGKAEREIAALPSYYERLQKEIRTEFEADFKKAYEIREKQTRVQALNNLRQAIQEKMGDKEEISPVLLGEIIKDLEKDVMRKELLKNKTRIDGRTPNTIRDIVCETGILPRAHGSALFTRGETQALVVTTLGTPDDEQIIDALAGEYRERFMLHYNFPPFSVGETGRVGSPGRREVGHGKLAWRALAPDMPTKDTFPYTIRVVSEILESNGSSSMATVCGASLAMMDAGVPLNDHISGIAMGLVKEGEEFVVLSDILGDEDHLGDMDFKVTGTREGVTALQMDLKITSINEEIMKKALEQALEGRLHILSKMEEALPTSRGSISSHAPQIVSLTIPVDKIRDVIGSGGKVIREICETTGTKINIEDDGKVTIAGVGKEKLDKALEIIHNITAEPEEGGIYMGKVTKITDFGAFVNFLSTFGLVHISELAPHRVEKVADVVQVGDEVRIKVIGFDNRGKLRLSMKALHTEDD